MFQEAGSSVGSIENDTHVHVFIFGAVTDVLLSQIPEERLRFLRLVQPENLVGWLKKYRDNVY